MEWGKREGDVCQPKEKAVTPSKVRFDVTVSAPRLTSETGGTMNSAVFPNIIKRESLKARFFP